jgi:CRP/FNR family cyclic AMP-dependent transcriptional regulator
MQANYFESRNMRPLGMAHDHAVEIHRLIERAPIIEDFTLSEVTELGEYMPVYEATKGTCIIGEGEKGDFMLIVITGSIDVEKRDRTGQGSRIAVVHQGHALGEMSMLDGEPRFASCIAVETTRFAVLTRENLVQLIQTKPRLGAKILMKLVHMLAQRLRNTSAHLVDFLEKERGHLDEGDLPLE